MNGYDETMKRMKDADGWDIQGIISDARQTLMDAAYVNEAAVIDSLVARLRDINKCLSGPVVNARTIGEAAKLVALFPEQKSVVIPVGKDSKCVVHVPRLRNLQKRLHDKSCWCEHDKSCWCEGDYELLDACISYVCLNAPRKSVLTETADVD